MPTKKLDARRLLKEVESLGRKIQDVGRALVTTTEKTVRTAAEGTLGLAEDAVVTARKRLTKAGSGARATTKKAARTAQRTVDRARAGVKKRL